MTRFSTGMSLAELLIVACLLCIIGSIALPAFANLIQSNRLETLADQLQGQLARARAHSVANHREMELCGTADGATCISSWENGWIWRAPSNGAVLNHQRIDELQQLRWTGFSKKISFYHNGTTKLGNGRFYICDRQGAVAWQLVINKQGRIRRIRGLEKGQQVSKPCG